MLRQLIPVVEYLPFQVQRRQISGTRKQRLALLAARKPPYAVALGAAQPEATTADNRGGWSAVPHLLMLIAEPRMELDVIVDGGARIGPTGPAPPNHVPEVKR